MTENINPTKQQILRSDSIPSKNGDVAKTEAIGSNFFSQVIGLFSSSKKTLSEKEIDLQPLADEWDLVSKSEGQEFVLLTKMETWKKFIMKIGSNRYSADLPPENCSYLKDVMDDKMPESVVNLLTSNPIFLYWLQNKGQSQVLINIFLSWTQLENNKHKKRSDQLTEFFRPLLEQSSEARSYFKSFGPFQSTYTEGNIFVQLIEPILNGLIISQKIDVINDEFVFLNNLKLRSKGDDYKPDLSTLANLEATYKFKTEEEKYECIQNHVMNFGPESKYCYHGMFQRHLQLDPSCYSNYEPEPSDLATIVPNACSRR